MPYALTYRIFNSLNPPGNVVATGTTRKVWEVEATVAPALVLQAGTYWKRARPPAAPAPVS